MGMPFPVLVNCAFGYLHIHNEELKSSCPDSQTLPQSLTPKSFLVGMKNSLLEDFLLAKHKDTNIPTMMEPFSSPAAWF
jgi:hypothetical protein